MGRVVRPLLFSARFGVAREDLKRAGLLDPVLNGDTKLFLDPVLLTASANESIQNRGSQNFKDYFGQIISLLQRVKYEGDVGWRTAKRLLDVQERPELCLGYGGGSTRGRRIARGLSEQLTRTAKEIVDIGIDAPELFAVMGLLEEGVGADTIGDMTATAILPALVEITTEFSTKYGVETHPDRVGNIDTELPINPFTEKPILLVPMDILRDLPVALDWASVSKVAKENERIRSEINQYIGDIWNRTSKRQKALVKIHALKNADAFKSVLDAVYLLREDGYDFEADLDGHELFRRALAGYVEKYPLRIKKPKDHTGESLVKIVRVIVEHFKQLIENNGVNELLWYEGKPRKERASQKLFFAVADVYCRMNNLDISPESDSGGGPVDFKFSAGYDDRILVELKLSSGQVVHGYEKQLQVYEDAARSFSSYLLVVDVGGIGSKWARVSRLKEQSAREGRRAPELVRIDARIKPSASKR